MLTLSYVTEYIMSFDEHRSFKADFFNSFTIEMRKRNSFALLYKKGESEVSVKLRDEIGTAQYQERYKFDSSDITSPFINFGEKYATMDVKDSLTSFDLFSGIASTRDCKYVYPAYRKQKITHQVRDEGYTCYYIPTEDSQTINLTYSGIKPEVYLDSQTNEDFYSGQKLSFNNYAFIRVAPNAELTIRKENVYTIDDFEASDEKYYTVTDDCNLIGKMFIFTAGMIAGTVIAVIVGIIIIVALTLHFRKKKNHSDSSSSSSKKESKRGLYDDHGEPTYYQPPTQQVNTYQNPYSDIPAVAPAQANPYGQPYLQSYPQQSPMYPL